MDKDTLLLECVRQYLKSNGMDVFFSLELTVRPRHPLCFAIAHDEHGLQITTGWTKNPQRFPADFNEQACNILFESQVSNYAKSDFNSADYPRILEEAKLFPQNCEYYSRLDSVPPIKIQSSPYGSAYKSNISVFTDIFKNVSDIDDVDVNDDEVLTNDLDSEEE